MQKGKGAKGKSGSFNGICYNCGKSGHSANFCYAKGGKTEEKGQGKKRDSKGGMRSKVGQSEGDGQTVKVGTLQEKVWEQQMPAGMNNLDGDQKQYDVLVTEMSTQEKTERQ